MALSLWAALVLLVLPGCDDAHSQGQPEESVLARVEGEPVATEAFRKRYTDHLVQSGLADTPQRRREVLDGMIDVELVARAMREDGAGQTAAYRRELETVQRRYLLDAYRQAVVFDTVTVSEADLRELFAQMNTKLHARHLYARTREQADALYRRLQAGASFEQLARDVFADPELAASGGDVGYFGFDEMDPAFEQAAHALAVGETSRPVRTAYGYSIIQLLDRRRETLLTEETFEQKRGQVRTYALRRARIEAHYQASRRLAEELAPAFDEEGLEALYDHLVDGALVPGGADGEAWLQRPLVTFGPASARQTWTMADFYREAQYTTEEQQQAVRSHEQLEAFVSGLVVRDELLGRARAAGLHQRDVYRDAVEAAMDRWLYRQARERVRDEVELAPEALRMHYTMHRTDYVMPERVRVHEVLLASKEEAEAVKARAGTEPFEALARQHSQRPGASDTGGDLGYVSRSQVGHLAEAVFAAERGDVIGPLEVAGHYVLLHVGDRRPGRPRTFEEAQAEVADELREQQARAAFSNHLHTLRNRYDISVDAEQLLALRIAP